MKKSTMGLWATIQFVVIWTAFAGISSASTYNVAPNSDSDCSDSNCSLQAALHAAEINGGGDTVLRLQEGQYSGNFTYFPGAGHTGALEILGGWNDTFTSQSPDPQRTVLDGNAAGTVLNLKLNDLENPAIVAGDVKVQGLTIKNGSSFIGGGLLAFTAAPSRIDIEKCIIENNHAEDAAGGFAAGAYDFATTNTGGALYVRDNIIRNNSVSSPEAIEGSGGGCDIFSNGITVLQNNLIYGNTVCTENCIQGDGAGMNIFVFAGDAYIVNNTITQNVGYGTSGSSFNGGGLALRSFPAGTSESSLVSWAPGHVFLYNTIVAENKIMTSNSYGADIANNIHSSALTAGSSLLISHSDYLHLWNEATAISPDLEENLSLSPVFSESAEGNFQLKSTSPCIDSGLNTAAYLPDYDLVDTARILDGNADATATTDMGCYEYVWQKKPTTLPLLMVYPLLLEGEKE